MGKAESYTLRQVVELTGLSEFTLRGWENRYRAFCPNRTESGRRFYSTADLQRAMLLRELTKRGHRIGEIATLSRRRLDALLEDKDLQPKDRPKGSSPEVGLVLKHLPLQEWDELEKILSSVCRRNEPQHVIRNFVLPLLKELGERVASGHVTISQEHILSALLKQQLHRMQIRKINPKAKSRLLIAAPEGDFHELGILVAHAMAGSHGLRSLYLGPNSPKKELCETALRFRATNVLIGSTISRKEGAKEELYSYIHFLSQHLPKSVVLWIGGRNSSSFQAELGRKCKTFSSLLELECALEELAGT